MGTVVGLPRKPDLGEIKSLDHPEEGTLLNVAGIVEMCRTSRSDRARKVYREFLKAWDRIQDRRRPRTRQAVRGVAGGLRDDRHERH